jgi:hypothetical protein
MKENNLAQPEFFVFYGSTWLLQDLTSSGFGFKRPTRFSVAAPFVARS